MRGNLQSALSTAAIRPACKCTLCAFLLPANHRPAWHGRDIFVPWGPQTTYLQPRRHAGARRPLRPCGSRAPWQRSDAARAALSQPPSTGQGATCAEPAEQRRGVGDGCDPQRALLRLAAHARAPRQPDAHGSGWGRGVAAVARRRRRARLGQLQGSGAQQPRVVCRGELRRTRFCLATGQQAWVLRFQNLGWVFLVCVHGGISLVQTRTEH